MLVIRRFLACAASLAATLALAPATAAAQNLLPMQPAERCVAAPASLGTAAEWLERAARFALPPSDDGMVLRYRASFDRPLWEQSDRMYEPFIPSAQFTQRWYDPASGVEARQPADRPLKPGQAPTQLFTETTSYVGRDTVITPIALSAAATTSLAHLNPWLVVESWRAHAADVRVTGRCLYRDAWRVVLTRGDEQLYLSESDATPIKFQDTESHYLWGQVKVEILWSTWWGTKGGGMFPNATTVLYDGTVYERGGIVNFQTERVPRDSAPRMTMPPVGTPVAAPPPGAVMLNAQPDTIRVSANTFLLRTPIYTEGVTLQRDTVFLLDATTGEDRARQDSTWIAALFPGKHPLVLIVTDLAWPHISGVRFWVARGAIIASDRASEAFLRSVVSRRWTLNPDALERNRSRAAFRFRAVTDSMRLGGGTVVLHALHNTSTETAIGAWIPGDRFFWVGDYLQTGTTSPYARDIVATIRALGLTPVKVAAQHVPLTDWSALAARFPVATP